MTLLQQQLTFYTKALRVTAALKSAVRLSAIEKASVAFAIRISPLRAGPLRFISIRTVGPEEMQFKAGTAIQFETTFTDADGNLYNPDANTVKLYIKKPDGTYYTGYAYGVSGVVMTNISTGLYRATFQSARGDAVGTWKAEVEGKVGAVTSFDDLPFAIKV